jgi:hypothetical protein
MSMYNMLFGVNSLSPILLEILELEPHGEWPTGRFRDIYLNSDGSQIILYGRDGGGNREYGPFEELERHPNYLSDEDDDFDCTYSYVSFSVPNEYLGLCTALATGEDPETISERFQNLIEGLGNAE